jgi:hypothetical protein
MKPVGEPQTMAVVPSWIEAHCIVPDGFRKGRWFRLYDYQLRFVAAFYAVRGDVEFDPVNPILGSAFVYRRGLLVGPQKVGKNPLIAAQVCAEGVGPVLFAGWAGPNDGYACADHGCRCGWEYVYLEGEPMGMQWPTPLIQITAFSQESTENTYDALRPMIDDGPLHDLIPHTGEEFIRLPGGGRIDTVTSSAHSRLGQRVTFVPQDEVGVWTASNGMVKLADTQYRGLSGMGGRAALTSNAWDPSEHSVAQLQFESTAADVWRQFDQPPANLSYGDKRERHKIHLIVYPKDTRREQGGHVDLDAVEAEAADLVTRDAAQAARFYGNKLVAGAGKAFDLAKWDALAKIHEVPAGAAVAAGFDGSRYDDATALVGCEIEPGYLWPLEIWTPPPAVPVDEVDATVGTLFDTWEVWRLYGDPPKWESWLATWSGRYGKDRVLEWWTASLKKMANACMAFERAVNDGELSHSGDAVLSAHIGNATRHWLGFRDDSGAPLWVIRKETPMSPLKIDGAVAAILAWQARRDALAAGVSTSISLPDPVAIWA